MSRDINEIINCRVGKNFKFKNNDIIIEEFLGVGANCIAWKIKMTNRHYVLKEYCPYTFSVIPLKDRLGFQLNDTQIFDKLYNKYKIWEEDLIGINALLNDATDGNDTLNRYLCRDFEGEKVESFDKENCMFSYATLHNYTEQIDFNNTDLKTKIKFLKTITTIIGKFHKAEFVVVDIKPENFLVSPDDGYDIVQLIDFDSIQRLNNDNPHGIKSSSFYQDPKIFDCIAFQPSKKSDIYSLGAMLLSFFFEELPAKDVIRSMRLFKYEQLDCNSDFSYGFFLKSQDIIKKATNSNLENRYNSCEELANDLVELINIFEQKSFSPEAFLDIAKQKYATASFEKKWCSNVKEINN